MLRTALGFAGARDPSRRIADAGALGRYQHVAVQLVRSCLLQRRGAPSSGPSTSGGLSAGPARGVPCMLELLEKIDAAALTSGDAYLNQDLNPEPKQPFMATAALRLFEQLDGGAPSTEEKAGKEGEVAPEAEAKKDA